MMPSDDRINAHIIEVEESSISIEIEGVIKKYGIIETSSSIYLHHADLGNLIIDKLDRLPVKEVEKLAGGYEAPMPAQVIKVIVEEGQVVSTGDALVIISSMKMESTIEAETDGVVEEIYVADNQAIEAGHIMLKIKVKED